MTVKCCFLLLHILHVKGLIVCKMLHLLKLTQLIKTATEARMN